ncbi:unnamed protein product [Hyaloperonospora brassicae]|uniref:HIT-type domain-containing protein n=1 Tax=Hyaloperonospora brassicae TaxID=162125 RepID=A0AAV0UJU2_HYABA|nr:unnamed protein product [Hyaloperonospora brassicae]
MTQLCGVCTTTEAKYKCPTCRLLYCSLVCCKTHKETPCAPPAALEKPPVPTVTSAPPMPMDEESERLTAEQLNGLRTSAGIKELLADPVVTQTLTQIDSSLDKTKALEKALLAPTFAKFLYQALDEVAAVK